MYKSDFKYVRGLFIRSDNTPGEFSVRGAVDTSYIPKHFCISSIKTPSNRTEDSNKETICASDPGNKLELYETSIFYCLIIPGHPLKTELSALSEQGVGVFPITSGYQVHSTETNDQTKLTLSE
jgi:hypothetical protein